MNQLNPNLLSTVFFSSNDPDAIQFQKQSQTVPEDRVKYLTNILDQCRWDELKDFPNLEETSLKAFDSGYLRIATLVNMLILGNLFHHYEKKDVSFASFKDTKKFTAKKAEMWLLQTFKNTLEVDNLPFKKFSPQDILEFGSLKTEIFKNLEKYSSSDLLCFHISNNIYPNLEKNEFKTLFKDKNISKIEKTIADRVQENGFKFFRNRGEGKTIGEVIFPLPFYQEISKHLWPASGIELVPTIGLSTKEELIKLLKNGQSPVVYPLPQKRCEVYDGRLSPAYQGAYHDIYHSIFRQHLKKKTVAWALDVLKTFEKNCSLYSFQQENDQIKSDFLSLQAAIFSLLIDMEFGFAVPNHAQFPLDNKELGRHIWASLHFGWYYISIHRKNFSEANLLIAHALSGALNKHRKYLEEDLEAPLSAYLEKLNIYEFNNKNKEVSSIFLNILKNYIYASENEKKD